VRKSTPANGRVHATYSKVHDANGQVHATYAKVHVQMNKYIYIWTSTCANGQVHLSKQTISQISILNDVASKIEIFNVLETKKDRQHVPIF